MATILWEDSGNEVIIPAITYVGCAAAFDRAQWKVVFADVDPATGLIDPRDVEKKITSRTRAVLTVDTYGQRAPDIAELSRRHNLYWVHDAAHRIDLFDSALPNADFVCYSFGPTKEVASPEGGLIWSLREEYQAAARSVSLVGLNIDTWSRSRDPCHTALTVTERFGLKLRQNDVCAAFVLAGLDHVAAERTERRRLYDEYSRLLIGTKVIRAEREPSDSLLLAYFRTDESRRETLRQFLAECNVATSDHYPSLARLTRSSDTCPMAERFSREVFILPLYSGLSLAEVAFVAKCIRDA